MGRSIGREELEKLHSRGIGKSTEHLFVYRFPDSDKMPLMDANDFAEDLEKGKSQKKIALYLHVPFCSKICHYCHYFTQLPGNRKEIGEYKNAVEREISTYRNLLKEEVTVDSILFGGGTPTTLEAGQLNELVLFLRAAFPNPKGIEVTIESSPETIGFEKLVSLRQNFNRLSIGMQDFNDKVLKDCNRNHSKAQALKAIENAREAGFDNVNIDLLYGLPGQGAAGWEKTLEEIEKIQPESVTASDLRVQKGSEFYSRERKEFASEQELVEMHSMFAEKMLSLGYERLFPYQFLKRGKEMRFLENQWQSGEFLGLGPSSCSFLNNWDYNNVFPTGKYVETVKERGLACAVGKKLSKEERMKRFVALGLKNSKKGVDKREFKQRFGLELEERFGDIVELLHNLDLVVGSGGTLKLTEKGNLFYDAVSRKFF